MELKDYREKIDAIDAQLLPLFLQRMEVAAEIAAWKKANGIPVLDAGRERAKLRELEEKTPEELRDYTDSLYQTIFELSRSSQTRLLGVTSPLTEAIEKALADTPQLFPESASVACQGVEGAYSQLACDRLFRRPNVFYFASFEAVFTAIEKGLCRFGVIPLENSTAGSVNAVYDLMRKHDFRIVRSVRLKVDHNLLAKPGTKLADIREIYSHEQAIGQCSKFLNSLNGVRVIPCDNTAMAAKMVAEKGDRHAAAISSHPCAALYGLTCLNDSIQDSDNNYTRFICITKDPVIYAGANRISLIIAFDNRPGALYEILSKLAALDINMTKLESCPVAGSDFEFVFFLELDASVQDPSVLAMLEEMERSCAEFQFLGNYAEV